MDGKMDFNDFKRTYGEDGLYDEEFDEAERQLKKNVHILTFKIDKKKTNVVSQINSTIVFVEFEYLEKVNVGDTWICMTAYKNGVYYATPIEKISPAFLVNFDSRTRDAIISELWQKNRKVFESDFAERYKQEITEIATQQMEEKYKSVIDRLQREKSDLESQMDHLTRMVQHGMAVPAEEIELGSEEITGEIEIGSEEPDDEIRLDTQECIPPAIPRPSRRPTPGFPEIKTQDNRPAQTELIKYKVERVSENVISSDSFTDLKYFVHISPDCKTMVIRQNDYGSAICINKCISLKGLDKLVPFTGRKPLIAEYSAKYDGMIVFF